MKIDLNKKKFKEFFMKFPAVNTPFTDEECNKALSELIDLCICEDGTYSSWDEINKYCKYVPILLASYICTAKIAVDVIDKIIAGKGERANKRWTDFEDNKLIELVCSGQSIYSVAYDMNRSVAAIQNRLTHLVGVNRISQSVAGKFVGTANGSEFTANLIGKLFKGGEP